MEWLASATRWLFDTEHGAADRLIPRWLFLRALGCIYFSAFFSLAFQIRGLIGPNGILPANEYLQAVAHTFGHVRGLWFAPTVLWFSSGPHILMALCWVGMGASLLLVVNLWPRGMLAICFVCFLSFVAAAQDFSGYQSDGMLLEAGFISLFFAPGGIAAWVWAKVAADAREPVPAAMGMVSHLLRIRRSEDYEWRAAVAALYRDGRILSEWPAANLDRLVHATFAALVSCFDGIRHARARIGFGVDAVFAAPLAHCLFLYCDSLGARRYFHGELHVFELSGAGVRGLAAG